MALREQAKVLIADTPELEDVLRSCFAMHQVTYVSTWEEAVDVLDREHFDAAVIGMLFAGSHMFELVQWIRADKRRDAMVVVCVRGRSTLRDKLNGAVRQAVRAIGADEFFDFVLDQASVARLCEDIEAVVQRRRLQERGPASDRRE